MLIVSRTDTYLLPLKLLLNRDLTHARTCPRLASAANGSAAFKVTWSSLSMGHGFSALTAKFCLGRRERDNLTNN